MASTSPAATRGSFSREASGWDLGSVLGSAWANKLGVFVLAPSIAVFLWFSVAYQTSPLKKYPGPFLAGPYLNLCPIIFLSFRAIC